MATDYYKIMGNAEVWMLHGRRFSLKEIRRFEEAVMHSQLDGQIETMMLLFTEAMHDTMAMPEDEIFRVMSRLNTLLLEFQRDVNDRSFSIDDVRLRVYEKTNYIFAMNDADREHIRQLLKAHGYDPDEVEAELAAKEERYSNDSDAGAGA